MIVDDESGLRFDIVVGVAWLDDGGDDVSVGVVILNPPPLPPPGTKTDAFAESGLPRPSVDDEDDETGVTPPNIRTPGGHEGEAEDEVELDGATVAAGAADPGRVC